MLFGSIFTKIFQGGDALRYLLYLIEEQERVAWDDVSIVEQRDSIENLRYVEAIGKQRLCKRIAVTVDIDKAFVFSLTKFLQDVSLAHLPSTK